MKKESYDIGFPYFRHTFFFRERSCKEYDLADKIREELTDLGVEIKDTSEGTSWNIKS